MMKGIEFGSDLKVRLPSRFNVAVPFVDRHLAEGRGAKVAIRAASETITRAPPGACSVAPLPSGSAAMVWAETGVPSTVTSPSTT